MVLSQQNFKFFLILIIIISIGWYLLYSDLDYHQYHEKVRVAHEKVRIAVKGKKGIFVEKAIEVDIDGPYDNTTIIRFCELKEWRDGLVFHCETPRGGIANIRNMLLNCLRYALEAGATTIVIPELKIWTPPIDQPNSETDLEKRKIKEDIDVPFSHLYDLDFFQQSLSEACPRIKFISHINDLYTTPSTQNPHNLDPGSLIPDKLESPFQTLLAYPSTWAKNFTLWLNETEPTFSTEKPVRITIQNALLHWPLTHDPSTFVAQFGRLIRPTLEIRSLACTVLFALTREYNLPFDPELGIQENMFYGAHLRTASDAKEAGWTPFETQMGNYLQAAKHNRLNVVYLVSASQRDIKRFEINARDYSTEPIAVATAEWLLGKHPSSLKIYRELSAAQRSLVDYEVLLKSSVFGGTLESSYSWNVALRRHVVWGNGSWVGQDEEFTWDRAESGYGRDREEGMREGPVGGYGGGGFQSFRDGAGGRGRDGRGVLAWGGREGGGWGRYGLSVVFGDAERGQEWVRGLWP